MPAVNDPVVEYNYFKCCMYKCQLLMYPVVEYNYFKCCMYKCQLLMYSVVESARTKLSSPMCFFGMY